MKNFSTEQGCVCCGQSAPGSTCLHHLITKKSRPDLQYSDFNLIPVCQKHHNQFHSKGTYYMSLNFFTVDAWLKENGWEFDEFMMKWTHQKAFKKDQE